MKHKILLSILSTMLAICCCGCNEQNNVEQSAGNIESHMKEVLIGQAEIAANIHSTQDEETCENDVPEVDENISDEVLEVEDTETVLADVPEEETIPEIVEEEIEADEGEPIPIPELKVEETSPTPESIPEPTPEPTPAPAPVQQPEQPSQPAQGNTTGWTKYEIPTDWGNCTENIVMYSDEEARAWQAIYPNGWLRTEDDMLLFTPAGKPAPPPEEIVYVSEQFGYKVGDTATFYDEDGTAYVMTYVGKNSWADETGNTKYTGHERMDGTFGIYWIE